jgi:predicted site-specific integrase-resolvase
MEKWIKLSKWAKSVGLTYRTANRHFKEGKIPHKTKILPSGGLLVCLEENNIFVDRDCILYCRVSSPNKKDDLIRQIERCKEYAIKNGYNITKIYKEVASGMNDNRRELNKIFNDLDSKNFTLIIENKDRLTRFGFRYIEKFIYSKNSKLIVINNSDDDQQDLMKDLISIITSFCCRIYGLRRGANKARNIKNSIVNI